MMRLQKSSLAALIFIILLATSHLANCRQIKLATTEEKERQITITEVSFPFSRRLSSLSHSEYFSNYKAGPIHSVSHQTVPAGPNPLHN